MLQIKFGGIPFNPFQRSHILKFNFIDNAGIQLFDMELIITRCAIKMREHT